MINVATPYLTINSVSVSSGVTISSVSNIMYINGISAQFVWTGNPTGTFFVQTSQDYNPGTPQSRGALNAGTWDSWPLSPVPTTSSGSSYTVDISAVHTSWVRLVFDCSTGSGVLSARISGKTQG